MTEDQIREIEQDVFRAAIDYGKSPAPSFDAVEDIKNYLGDRYDKMAEIMKSLHRSDFEAGCEMFLGNPCPYSRGAGAQLGRALL